MRVFANLFLILFIADGGFSLVDELVSLLTPLMPFTALRNFLAILVIFLSVPIYFSLGVDRRLPKRIFLPMIILIFWTLVSTWLFPALAGFRLYGLILAIVQVVMGMLPLYHFHNGSERRLTMSPKQFEPPFFNLKNTLIFCAFNLLVIPLVLLLSILIIANANIAEFTAGFIHIKPSGLVMTERIYKRANRSIRLTAMIHVGNKEYYTALADSLSPGRTIVLAEGVSDDKKIITNKIDYGRLAGILGLTSQQKMLFQGKIIMEDEFKEPLKHTKSNDQLGTTDILRADVDISNFRQPTVIFLNAVGKYMRENPSFIKGLLALNSWAEKNITPDMNEIIMDDILHRRNLAVLSHLDKALESYDTVIIPWGALHMKEIEADVLKRGFVLHKERERLSINFKKLLL